MRNRVLLSALGIAVAVVLGAGAVAWSGLNATMAVDGDGTTLDIPVGASLSRVSAELAERGILGTPRLLALYGRLTGDATRIRAGEYRIEPGTSPLALLRQLVEGDVVLHTLTVVEGWRFEEFLEALRSHPAIVAGTEEGVEIMATLGAGGVHPEGQFFPDTYSFPRGTTDLDILRQAHDAMKTALETVWNQRQTLVLNSAYEALILASIIEKETALGSERHRISGVFSRRLERRMRLETDPTVIYGLGDDFDGDIRAADLAADTPYNTYRRFGLPPTPISLPGLASLRAAVEPDDGDALFFVATGEPDGSHYFSATLEEHNTAVARYLERLRSNN
ncbi:MAG TPA: endolytic transglycosylase MltG [Gammaproteobacteria bacterium]